MITTWGQRLKHNGICLALLFVLPLLVYGPSWLRGEIPLEAGALLAMPPWSAHETTDATVSTPLSSWQAGTVWPSYQFLNRHRESLAALQWNPTVGLGEPFVANPYNRAFSPFFVWFYLFAFSDALFLSLLSKSLAAGWVSYYVARRYGFTAWFGLIVALIFQWSGPFVIWQLEPLSDSLVWLPLLLLATDRLILGHFRSWPGVALVVAAMVLSGGLHMLAGSLVCMALYMLLRRLRDHKRAHIGEAIPGYALGVVAGFGLAAIQLLPYLELLREGNAIDHTYPWLFDSSLLLGLFGPSYYHHIGGGDNPLIHVVYIGVLPLLFIGFWGALRRLVERPLRHRIESLLFASVLVGAVPVLLQGLLPNISALRFLHPVHYLAGLSFPLGLMVAAVVETWLHLNADQCKRALLRMGIQLPIFWGGLLVLFVAFAWDAIETGAFPWGAFWCFTITSLTLLVLFGTTILYPKARILVAGTIALLLLTTAWSSLPWIPRAPRADVFPQTEVIRTLQEADARVGGTPRLAQWPLAGNEIPALYAPSTVMLNRTAAYLAQTTDSPLLQRRAGIGTLLLQKEDIQGAYAPVRHDLSIVDIFDSGLILFRDQGAKPRIRIAHEVASATTATLDLDASPLPVVPGVLLPTVSGAIHDDIRVIDVPRNDRLALEVETNFPGVLIVAEAWYPGWQAKVDDNVVPILPVDGVFRGVELGAGTHHVQFEYQSSTLRWGALISLLCMGLFLTGSYVARRRSSR